MTDKPRVIYISENMTVKEDSALNISCRCVGSPLPQITWNTPQKIGLKTATLYQQTSTTSINSTLVVAAADCIADNGVYTCICENEAGRDSKVVTLTTQCQ